MFLVENERIKLTANWLNTLATALVAAGLFAPAFAILYGLSQFNVGTVYMLILAAGCLAVGSALHVGGRFLLGRLRE